jgi:4-hydroxy-2-oxoheptanedioate aldolase
MRVKMERGETALGVTIQEFSPQSVEIMALLGFDYVNLDCLHSSLEVHDVAMLVHVAESRGISVVARVPQNVPEIILRYLDAGVDGIVVADMNDAEAARALVDAIRFPPEGDRGLASVHSSDYGLSGPLSEYTRFANSQVMGIGILESERGVRNAEEILSVPGLDAVIVGTTDLSKALGVAGQTSHPRVREAVAHILGAAQRTGKKVGITLKNGESVRSLAAMGFGFVGVHMKTLLIDAAHRHLKDFSGRAPE